MTVGQSDTSARVALVSQALLTDRPSFVAMNKSRIELVEVGYQSNATEFAESLRGFFAIIAGSEEYSRELMSSLPDLRIIARTGVGYDRIDTEAADDLGIFITVTPGVNSAGVAEHALTLTLALLHQVVHYDQRVRDGNWRDGLFYAELRGLTVGIVGYGSIGQALALLLKPFGVQVAVYDPFIDASSVSNEVTLFPNLETMLPECQILSIHVPLATATRHLIGSRELDLLPKGAYVINTSRGGVLNEAALALALRKGHLAGAALDVFEAEPPVGYFELSELPTCLFSPHIASFGHSTISEMSDMIAGQLMSVHAGNTPGGLVNSPKEN